jgi:nucleotide-binding universal stress UspA family protein
MSRPHPTVRTTVPAAGGTGPVDRAVRCVVVPLDLGSHADRALPVASALAHQVGAELAVVTVSSPHTDPLRDEAEIRWHAAAAGVTVDQVFVRHDDDVTAGVLAAAEACDGVLCNATHAYGRVAGFLLDGVAAELLRRSTAPLLQVGPSVVVTGRARRSVLLCADASAPRDETIAATRTWSALLDVPVEIVQVMAPDRAGIHDPAAERIRARLAELQVDAVPRVVLTHQAADDVMVEIATDLPDPLVIVGAHARRSHGSPALGPVSHGVVARSPHPILVVPGP